MTVLTKMPSVDCLQKLRQDLAEFPARSPMRRELVKKAAETFDVSVATIYRALKIHSEPSLYSRSDSGKSRIFDESEIHMYCELIAAMRIRTLNKKGRCLSTTSAIRILEDHGVHNGDNHVKSPKGLLKKSTVNRYLKKLGYDLSGLTKEPPAVRFQAEHSNDCWQFDLTPSDMKKVQNPVVFNQNRGDPILMLYSIVDDRSGMCYQEYHCVNGEDVGAALKFLFNAMSAKTDENLYIQGIPKILYTDNGPISKSKVFLQTMNYLGVEVKTHLPSGSDGNRTTARSKGKVERAFRSIKDLHEVIYHFHKPKNENEANQWLVPQLIQYNNMKHRYEDHSRKDDWIKNQPISGIQQMCSWERFCAFAREPEKRTVSNDCQISLDGRKFQVSPELCGEKVTIWWGLLDSEIYVEHDEIRYGPFQPFGGPIPFHKYKKPVKTNYEKRSEKIISLSKKISISKDVVERGVNVDISPRN